MNICTAWFPALRVGEVGMGSAEPEEVTSSSAMARPNTGDPTHLEVFPHSPLHTPDVSQVQICYISLTQSNAPLLLLFFFFFNP